MSSQQHDLSYATLFEQAKAGDKRALEQMYNKAKGLWLSRLVVDPTGSMEAKDFHAEADIIFCKKWDKWKPGSCSFTTYIVTVVNNHWINLIRANQRELEARGRSRVSDTYCSVDQMESLDISDLVSCFREYVKTKFPSSLSFLDKLLSDHLTKTSRVTVRGTMELTGLSQHKTHDGLVNLHKLAARFVEAQLL